MGLTEKLRTINDYPSETNLLEFLGVGPGEFRLGPTGLTVGGETISLAEARAAVRGGPIPAPSGRTVKIQDL